MHQRLSKMLNEINGKWIEEPNAKTQKHFSTPFCITNYYVDRHNTFSVDFSSLSLFFFPAQTNDEKECLCENNTLNYTSINWIELSCLMTQRGWLAERMNELFVDDKTITVCWNERTQQPQQKASLHIWPCFVWRAPYTLWMPFICECMHCLLLQHFN